MWIQTLSSLGVIAGYFVIFTLFKEVISRIGTMKGTPAKRIFYIEKFIKMLLIFLTVIVLSLIWGWDYKEVLLVATSFFAMVGIALFAQWSILSNVTSSIIIFFNVPYKIGDKIEIIDKEQPVKGTITEITLFHILLSDEQGDTISYPNNLILQKAIRRLNNAEPAAS